MYIGFLRKYILVDSRFFLVLSLLSVVFIFYDKLKDKKYKESVFEKIIVKVNLFLFLPLVIVYLLMIYLDARNYPNYVFATYHIQPQNFINIVYLSLALFLLKVDFFFTKEQAVSIFRKLGFRSFSESEMIRESLRETGKMTKDATSLLGRNIILAVLFFLLFFYFMNNLAATFRDAFSDLVFILSHPDYSYDQKMQLKWGLFYKVIALVRDNTSEGSYILLPDESAPHSVDARKEYWRPFLGNRKIENFYSGVNIKDFDYVLIAKGYFHSVYDGPPKKDYIWPDFSVSSDEIIYLIIEEGGNYVQKVVNEDYNPDNFRTKDVWGIIKIKK
ncbi:MAG: hypothetical protein CH104c_0299 [Candidatus Woesebacteria bacterium]|nr:MAG: hypothetical protein CH104c_0299 [Candidatus Woesebacteria bacterium]